MSHFLTTTKRRINQTLFFQQPINPEHKNVCLIYLSGFRFQLFQRIFSARITEPVSSQYLSPRRNQDLIFIRLFYIVHTQKIQSLILFFMFLNIWFWFWLHCNNLSEQSHFIERYRLHSTAALSSSLLTIPHPPDLLSSVLFIWILSSSSWSITQ